MRSFVATGLRFPAAKVQASKSTTGGWLRLSTPILAGALSMCLLGVGRLAAAEAVSAAVGYVDIGLLRDSDSVVAVPLVTSAEFSGQVSSVTAGQGGQFSIGVSGVAAFAADQFKQFYYVRFLSGARRGFYCTVVGNGADTLTLDGAGFAFSTIAAGDAFVIRKHWTLATLFPPAEAGTPRNPLEVSAGPLGPQRRSQIIIPDHDYQGINLPAAGVYYFTDDGWHQAVAGNPRADDVILYPDSSFTIRQPATVETDTTWSVVGAVAGEAQRIPLLTRTDGAQDNAVAMNRPFDVTLANSGLAGAFTASASTLGPDRRDQLLVYDNSVRGQNKSAAFVYYRVGSNWIKASAGNPAANGDTLAAGTGMVVRKAETANAAPAEWLNEDPQ